MKKKLNILFLLPVLMVLGVSCEPSEVTYSGADYVMFGDSVDVCPVTIDEKVFDVNIGATVAYDYDRNFAVEIIDRKSNAIEGVHYTIVSPNFTIKKGERSGSVQLKGIYKNIGTRDSLCVTLKLIADNAQKWDMYSDEINIQLVKSCPFHIDDFTGDMRFYATFPFSTSEVKTFMVKSEKVNDHRLVLKGLFDDYHEIKIDFDDSDPLEQTVTVPEQTAFVDASYGIVSIRSVDSAPSYFYPGEDDRLISMNLELYLAGIGRFGTYQYLLRWVDPQDADDEKNGLFSNSGAASPFSTYGWKRNLESHSIIKK